MKEKKEKKNDDKGWKNDGRGCMKEENDNIESNGWENERRVVWYAGAAEPLRSYNSCICKNMRTPTTMHTTVHKQCMVHGIHKVHVHVLYVR